MMAWGSNVSMASYQTVVQRFTNEVACVEPPSPTLPQGGGGRHLRGEVDLY